MLTILKNAEEIDRSTSTKLETFKLENLIKTEAYFNYTIFDFLNYYKIRRLSEMGVINGETEKQLLSSYRKYNTKMAELERYHEYDDLVTDFRDTLDVCRTILANYGIEPDKNIPLITIEQMVRMDIASRTEDIAEEKPKKTILFSPETIENINNAINRYILGTGDRRFIDTYNMYKVEMLGSHRYIPSNNVDIVKELYFRYLETGDIDLYKELTSDPYNLMLDGIKFDFAAYTDYIIREELKRKKQIIL